MVANCMLWADSLNECCDAEGYTEELIQAALAAATDILHERTCGRFGQCEFKKRPCICSCPQDCCCNYAPIKLYEEDIPLNNPIVTFYDSAGVETVLTSPDVRIDKKKYLVFPNGWAAGFKQNKSANLGDPNTWEIQGILGVPVPPIGVRAVQDLACEFLKACDKSMCDLPSTVRRVTRDGVSYDMADIAAGYFNIPLTDAFLRDFQCVPYSGVIHPLKYAGSAWS